MSFGRCTLDSRFIDGNTLLLGEMRRFGLEEFCSEIALLDFAFVALALLTAEVLDITLVSWVVETAHRVFRVMCAGNSRW